MTKEQIVISAGELERDVFDYLGLMGISLISVNSNPRCYKYINKDEKDKKEYIFVRAGSIPDLVSDPFLPWIIGGITGSDILWEAGKLDKARPLPLQERLPGFQPTVLYFGVTSEFLNKNLNGLTLATKYPNIARQFLLQEGICANIYSIPGKDEAMPYLSPNIAGVVGIRKTNATLDANDITVIKDIVTCDVRWIARKPNPAFEAQLCLPNIYENS